MAMDDVGPDPPECASQRADAIETRRSRGGRHRYVRVLQFGGNRAGTGQTVHAYGMSCQPLRGGEGDDQPFGTANVQRVDDVNDSGHGPTDSRRAIVTPAEHATRHLLLSVQT